MIRAWSTYCFLELPLVDADLLVDLVQCLLQQLNVPTVVLGLNHHFLHHTLLLPQDLDGFRMLTLLFVQLQFQVPQLMQTTFNI